MTKTAKRALIVVLCLLFVMAIAMLAACTEQYTVELKYESAQGTVTLDPQKDLYASGEKVTVNVAPNAEYEVDAATINGEAVTVTEGSFTFAVKTNTTVQVTFKPKQAELAKHTVTLNVDDNGAAVLEPHMEDNAYVTGSRVAVVATPNQGYSVASVKANGVTIQPNAEGKYEFTVVTDTVVDVKFVQDVTSTELSQQTYASLQGSILLDGEMVEYEYVDGSELASQSITLFDDAQKAVWLQEIFNGQQQYFAVFVDVNGKAALVTHNAQGKIELMESESSFAEYYNPFQVLEASDFVAVDDGVWGLVDMELASAAAAAITGYVENIEYFHVYEQDGKIVKVQIATQHRIISNANLDLQYVYTYDVKQHGSASIPAEWLQDYEVTGEHEQLKNALQKAASATSYTVQYHGEEEGYEDLDYNVYATQNGIYENLVGWENGYVKRGDGKAWAFTYNPDNDEFVFGTEPAQIDTIEDLLAVFYSEQLSLGLLENKGDGVWQTRPIDSFVMDEISTLNGAFASLFATGESEILYFSYAMDFTLRLRDGELYQVEFTYNLMGYIEERVTLTFTDFNSTELPIQIPDNLLQGKFTSEYVGNWSSEDGSYVISITIDTLTINNEEILDVEESMWGGYQIWWKGEEYALYIDEWLYVGSLILSDSNMNEIVLNRTDCLWVDFIGTFEGYDETSSYYKVVITEKGITATMFNIDVVATEIDFGYDYDSFGLYYYFMFYLYDEAFYLVQYDDVGDLWLLGNSDDSVSVLVERVQSGGNVDSKWASFIGTFEGEKDGVKYAIVITATKLTVSINDVVTEAVIVDFDNYEGFTITLNGIIYYVTNATYSDTVNSIAFMSEDLRSLQIVLVRSADVGGDINPTPGGKWSKFIGTFEGNNGDDVYQIVITANSVEVSINGVKQQVAIVEYSNYEGFTLLIGGEEFYLMDVEYDNEMCNTMYLMPSDLAGYVKLSRVA